MQYKIFNPRSTVFVGNIYSELMFADVKYAIPMYMPEIGTPKVYLKIESITIMDFGYIGIYISNKEEP